MSESNGPNDRRPGTYVESEVIMTTVRVVAPFSLTYGLFLTFHGADSPGGSFQGGAIVGATVLMIAFGFGIEPTRAWLRNRTVVALAAGGTVAFALVGLVPIALGGSFLEYPLYESEFGIDTKWGLEAIEILGVAPIVAGIVVGLFFAIGRGDVVDRTDDGPVGSGPDPDAFRGDGGATVREDAADTAGESDADSTGGAGR